MAENAFALTADGIELNEFGKLDKDDWDWGHLQPGQFRYCFLPRAPLRRPGDSDGDSEVSSVSSDGMMDQMAHIAEEGLHAAGAAMGAAAGVVGHVAYDASAKVGRAMANDLFGDDADAVVHKVEETIEDAERYAKEQAERAAAALHAAEEKASAVFHAGEDLAKKVGGEALHVVGDVGGKALHAVDDAAHAVGAEVLKDLNKVGDVMGHVGTGMFNKAKGLVGVAGNEELKHATDEDLAKAKAQAGLPVIRDDDSISTKATDIGVAEAKESEPQPEKKKRRSWFGSRGSRPSTSESRPGTGDKPKRRSFLSRFSRGSRASTPGEEGRPQSRDDDDTHTFTETIDDTLFDETTLDTEAYELRERDRKRAKKAIKDAREWLRDPTPLWARTTNWRLMLKGPLKEPLALPTKDAANEPIVYPKPIEEFESVRSLIEGVVAFLNPRSIGRAVRLGRRWAEVGYDEPLYYCLVQVGQPSVTIYAFQARVDAVVHTGEAILASGDKGVSAFHVDTGEFLGKTSIRDTSAIPTLFITGHSLWTCSRNGAIREWSLPHDVRNIEFRAQMWEHNAEVNDLTWTKSNPMFGGSTTEHPRLVSCSDDRSVRVWDPHAHHSTAVLNPFSHRSATMRSVYVSQEHLYVGGSDGTVYVYSVDGSTRSLRNREKKRVGLELIYPLETELKSGDEVIGAMCIANERTEQSRLFVTSWSGVVYVWKVPSEDLEYVLIHEIRHHTRRINNVLITRAHFLTCSDDGTIRYYGLCHGDQYEKALERVVDCGSRVKCIHVTPGDPGVVVAGLADGRVLVYELGNIM